MWGISYFDEMMTMAVICEDLRCVGFSSEFHMHYLTEAPPRSAQRVQLISKAPDENTEPGHG